VFREQVHVHGGVHLARDREAFLRARGIFHRAYVRSVLLCTHGIMRCVHTCNLVMHLF
jgi:hypothetical protein